MKTIFIFMLVIIGLQNGYSQSIVPSNCLAPDSIKALYKDDADKLAVRWILESENFYKDSVRIPDSISGKFLNALLALYNSQIKIAESDTVINHLKLHTSVVPHLNRLSVIADSNAHWMQKMRQNILPTGNEYIDSLISTFSLQNYKYYDFPHFDHSIDFRFQNYNPVALAKLFEKAEGVIDARPLLDEGDGSDLIAELKTDYIELIYIFGWGDCPSGCFSKRYWKFRVYNDCSVEFVESYGDKILFDGFTENILHIPVSVYPNPFENTITVNGLNAPFQYSITNILGQIVAEGKSNNNTVKGFENLERGVYLLKLKTGEKTSNIKLLKN
jgi:hypothetical protein